MFDNDAVEFHDEAAHFKELLCTYSSDRRPDRNPCDNPLTYGYVKDMYRQLGFNRTPNALKTSRSGAAAHMSLHLDQQCQRAAKTDA